MGKELGRRLTEAVALKFQILYRNFSRGLEENQEHRYGEITT